MLQSSQLSTAVERRLKQTLGYLHALSDSFSCRREMQSVIVWPPIPYVTPGAASLRYRNRAEIFVLICKQKPYPLWFSIRRKTYPVKCENSLNLTLPTIMLANTSSSSDDITTRPWVREIITGSSNDIKKKSWSIYLSLPGELSCFFFYTGVVNVKCTRPTGKRKQTKRQKKKQESVQFHSFGADLSWSVRLHQ